MTGPGAPNRLVGSLFSGGLIYFALFVLVHALLALTSRGTSWTDGVCLALVALPQLAVILRRTFVLPTAATLLISLCLVLAAVVGLLGLRDVPSQVGYSAWFLGAITFDLFGLAIVGRFAAAWLTMLGVVAAAVGWALLRGEPAAIGGGLVIRHVATLVIGTALAVSLRRSYAAVVAFRSVQLRRHREEEVARARAGARRSGVEQVLEQAGPMLRAIAAGHPLGAEDRRQMLVLEGALRDRIRTPRLRRGPLVASLDRARRRGVNVLLLDETQGAPADLVEKAVAWLADRLDAVADGGFVGRLRPAPDGGLRVSAVADDRGEAVVLP